MSRMSDFSHLRQIYTLYQWNKLKTELFLRSFMKSDVQQDVFFLICALKRGSTGGLFKENRAFAKCRECPNFRIYGTFAPFLDGFSSKLTIFRLTFEKKHVQ